MRTITTRRFGGASRKLDQDPSRPFADDVAQIQDFVQALKDLIGE